MSQLFKAESAGHMKDQKLTPRIADTARVIWGTYFVLSVGCFLAYRWAGMSWVDAFMHMCSTVSLGGFSSDDASFGHWNSARIEGVAMVFMLRIVHPSVVNPVILGGQAISDRVIQSVIAFMMVYGASLVGPAVNYGVLPDFQTWVCSFAMLLGRLELLSLLVLFTPAFWRK